MSLQITFPHKNMRFKLEEPLTHGEFESLCLDNPELVIEREPDGTLVIISPVGFNSGRNEAKFVTRLTLYAEEHGGEAVSTSTGITLPDASVRSADGCYFSPVKIANLPEAARKGFPNLVPDFIVEVLSESDKLIDAQVKMQQVWMANGVRLGWLVDVEREKLWIYRQNGTVDLVTPFEQVVTGEDVLPGFEFDLQLLS